MGKGSRLRSRGGAARSPALRSQAGASFGIKGQAPEGDPAAPLPAAPGAGDRRLERDRWQSATERLGAGLARLEELAAVRRDARRALAHLDEAIAAEVAHVRVDGATWTEIARALEISRQGARQRFGEMKVHRTTQVPNDPQTSG